MKRGDNIYYWLLLFVLTVLAIVACGVAQCSADYLLEISLKENCKPCEAMKPVVAKVKRDGYPVRVMHAEDWPAGVNYYRPRGYPYFRYVQERGGKHWPVGAPVIGQCSADELKSLYDFRALPTRRQVRDWWDGITVWIEL